MIELRIVKFGNALGVQLPPEVLERMHLADGDSITLTEVPDGGYRLAAGDPRLDEELAIAEQGIGQYRNTLTDLAK